MRYWIGLGCLFSSLVFADTYKAVIDGKDCKEDAYQQLTCDYLVGRDLNISIIDIGSAYTAIYFMKADFEGDYYPALGVRHGCVIVKRKVDISDLAFISPKNGKVYKDWVLCGEGV